MTMGDGRKEETKAHVARYWVTGALLFIIGAGSLVVGLRGYRHPLPGPVISRSVQLTSPVIVSPHRAIVRSAPVLLRIPAINLQVPVSSLGINPNGTVQVPTNFQEPGWYRLGPSPGQVGSAVILGHVDSYLGPAVFFQLRSLVAGDQIQVTLADGVVADFSVRMVAMYSKQQFPSLQVYGSHGYSALQLVTCGGVFDTQTRSYLSNIVAYTSLVSIESATRPGRQSA